MPRAAAALLLAALLALPGLAAARACEGAGPLLLCDEGEDGAPDRASLHLAAPPGTADAGIALDAAWGAALHEANPVADAGAAFAARAPAGARAGGDAAAATAGLLGIALGGGYGASVPYVLHSAAGASALASPWAVALGLATAQLAPQSSAFAAAALGCGPSQAVAACSATAAALDARTEAARLSPMARWDPAGMPYACARGSVAQDACVEPWLP